MQEIMAILPFLLPALIGGAATLAGGAVSGMLNKSAADSANASQEAVAARNIALQKEFAKSGIQWKVEDARKAGVHPLAALGAQTVGFQPVSVGTAVPDMSGPGTAISQFGQDISRAMDASRTHQQKNNAVAQTMQQLTLQRMGLENQLLASQIAKVNQSTSSPAMQDLQSRYLVDGQGDASLIDDQPLQRVMGAPENLSQEPGAVTDLGFTRTRTGYAPVMSKDAKERLEEDFIGGLTWNVRNRLLPSVANVLGNPPPMSPGDGRKWHFNPLYQEWQSIPKWGSQSYEAHSKRLRMQDRAYQRNR